jgi:hypothetical protein
MKSIDGRLLAAAAALLLAGIILLQGSGAFQITDALRYWLFLPMAAI